MMVPGHDGRKGFGGACFPKDSYALYKYSKLLNVEFSLLKNVIDINNKIRLSYNDLSEREKIRILIMILTKLGPSGGIGRHKGLKIPR